MYSDGQLNPAYQTIVSKDIDVVMCMRELDAMGFDCRALIRRIASIMSGGEGDENQPLNIATIAMMLHEQLQKAGITEEELLEMSEDSGLDLGKLIADLIVYFMEQPESDENSSSAPAKRAERLIKAIDISDTPATRNEELLRDWLSDYL